jgi:hypothetical protein
VSRVVVRTELLRPVVTGFRCLGFWRWLVLVLDSS